MFHNGMDCIFMTEDEYNKLCGYRLCEEGNGMKHDNVNHPSHYETGKFECIDVMLEVFGKNAVMQFCRCNAFKYLYRMDNKNGYEDIQKAKWYIDKYIDLAEN